MTVVELTGEMLSLGVTVGPADGIFSPGEPEGASLLLVTVIELIGSMLSLEVPVGPADGEPSLVELVRETDRELSLSITTVVELTGR